jgi:hypothetical protein
VLTAHEVGRVLSALLDALHEVHRLRRPPEEVTRRRR